MSEPNNTKQILGIQGDAVDRRTAQSKDQDHEMDDNVGLQATRTERIRAAAYAAAQRRDFEPGFELEDWLEAERMVDGQAQAAATSDTASRVQASEN